MPFCFNWANESWARTWSAIAHASPWADQYETDEQDDDSGMLMEQKYGNESAWQEHIRYLFPFFQDARYIRVDGRPVFMIYHPETVYCLSDMICCWNAYLRDHGDKEIYLITGVHDSAVPFAGLKSACDAYYMADQILRRFGNIFRQRFWQGVYAIMMRRYTGMRFSDWRHPKIETGSISMPLS